MILVGIFWAGGSGFVGLSSPQTETTAPTRHVTMIVDRLQTNRFNRKCFDARKLIGGFLAGQDMTSERKCPQPFRKSLNYNINPGSLVYRSDVCAPNIT